MRLPTDHLEPSDLATYLPRVILNSVAGPDVARSHDPRGIGHFGGAPGSARYRRASPTGVETHGDSAFTNREDADDPPTANVRPSLPLSHRSGRGGDGATVDSARAATQFVSLLSDHGVPVEEIARLVGYSSTTTTELVYRKQIRPVIQTGAVVLDAVFGSEQAQSRR